MIVCHYHFTLRVLSTFNQIKYEKNNLNSSCCQSNLLNTKKCVPTDKKSIFILILFIFLLLLNSCTKELNNFDDNSILSEEEETYQEFSKMRPFEAWLKTPTLKTRRSDSEITELIEYEKARFNKRFSFVEKYFKFIPVPQWESAKVVPYSNEETDIFILCENNYPDKFLLNKLVLVISKRGSDIFSFIKMLPKDEYLGVSITAIHDGENVHLMTNQIESDGAIISQNLGYLTEVSAEDEVVTRSIDCKYEFVDNSTQTFITTGDGDIDVINDIDQWIRFVCDDYGSSGGIYAPPAGSGAGSIPGYTPPSFGSSNGSSGGSNDSGNSGGNSGGGNSGYDGGAGGNSGYPGGGGGSSDYPGGGGGSSGYPGGGGGSSPDNSTPAFPEGGINLIPRPEFEGDQDTKDNPLIRSHSLNTPQMELLLNAINELFKSKDELFLSEKEICLLQALYDQLVNKEVKIDFRMYPNPTENSAAANYDPRYKSISFRENNTITKESLKEEFFHAFQDAFYPGGTAQYGKDSQGNKLPGNVNVEFEAKVFNDLTGGGFVSAFFKYETAEEQNAYNNYMKWIESVRLDPSILINKTQYNYWLNLFNELNPYYESPKSNDFSSFHSLNNLISKSNCF